MGSGQRKQVALALQIDEPYPQHQEVYAGIQRYARDRSAWHCRIDEHPGYDPRRRGHAPKYDGVIGRASPMMQRRLKRIGVPLVNTHYQTARPELAGVYIDPEETGALAADHLLDRGFRRLGIYVDPRHKQSLEMSASFKRRAAENDVPCLEVTFVEDSYADARYWASLERFLVEWLDALSPPVGLFIELAPVARQVIELAQSRGWHVPQEIAVLCQHNLKAVVEVSPQISSMALNYERVGYEAAHLLDRLMDGRASTGEQVFVPCGGVKARESTDYFAVEDELVAEALRLISANLREPLRIAWIADQLTVSPRSLQLRFDAALGRGISDEIRRLRLEAAKRLLAEPNRSIASIALQTGFSNTQVMGQVFRRELGETPSAYRKRSSGDLASSSGARRTRA